MATTQECCEKYWTYPGGNTPQSTSYTATYHPTQNYQKFVEPDMQEETQGDQLEPTYSSSVIGRSGEKRSGISVLMAWQDDDDIYIYIYIPTSPTGQDMTQGQFLSGV